MNIELIKPVIRSQLPSVSLFFPFSDQLSFVICDPTRGSLDGRKTAVVSVRWGRTRDENLSCARKINFDKTKRQHKLLHNR